MKERFLFYLTFLSPFLSLANNQGESNVYTWLTPAAIVFVLIEIIANSYYRRDYISFQESIGNFGTALGNQTSNVLVAAGVYVVYGYLWENFRIIDKIDLTPLNTILLLLGVDFIFYWVHRWGHHVNIMWAAHSPHHSAEEMNFMVALRASVTQRLFSFFFFWPLTIIGFHPTDLYMMVALHLFIAFLHHTEFIPKLWYGIELLFTTPSHHRVHHGVNFPYLDKNFGEFLIIWDRLFGTFAEEKEKVVYGMYNGPKTWNPIIINFHYYISLWNDAIAAPYFLDKIKIWFMPLGWRPRGLPQKPELIEITSKNQVRFTTVMFPNSKPYLVVQVLAGLVLMLLVINTKTTWSIQERWIGAALLWVQIVNWSGIMESKNWLCKVELIRLPLTSLVIFYFSHLVEKPLFIIPLIIYTITSMIWTWKFFK